MPRPISAPEKELRFTRSGQATAFWIAAAIATSAALTLLATSPYRATHPELPHPAWSLPPLAAAAILTRTAIHLTRHAYLILTPIGIEIFPFFRPAKGMRLIAWHEIHSTSTNPQQTTLSLHYNAAHSAGIHLSLKPLQRRQIPLLLAAIHGRIPPPHS